MRGEKEHLSIIQQEYDILKILFCKDEHTEYEDKSRRCDSNESMEIEMITSSTESDLGSLKL